MNYILEKSLRKVLPKPVLRLGGKALHRVKYFKLQMEMLLFPEKAKYFCPCCGLRFRVFTAGSYHNHPETYNPMIYENMFQGILCPYCRTLPRHRILALWCEKHMEMLQCADILYFAPEYGMALWMDRNGIKRTTADLVEKADIKVDIQATGLPDESFDVVFCNHVLEHVEDFRAAIREVYRILRTGGSFICSFPMEPGIDLVDEDPNVITKDERIKRFGQENHLRVFGMNADTFLKEAGFWVTIINGNEYPNEILPVVGPATYDYNCLFWCRK